jgi:hypothetical protein
LGMENHPNWRTPSFFRGVGRKSPTRNKAQKWSRLKQPEGPSWDVHHTNPKGG